MIDDLYSARILSLAAHMPRAGRLDAPHGQGEQVAKLCGSRAEVDVRLDVEGRIEDFAQTVKACALGQAAAAVIGEAIIGAERDDLLAARDAMRAMLKSGGDGPEGRFEGLRVLKAVADYPARHASTLVGLEATIKAVEDALTRRGDMTLAPGPEAERTRRAGRA